MTRKCRLCYVKMFARTPSWLGLAQCDASGKDGRPKDFPRIPRRRQHHHTPQCAWRIRIRSNMCRMFDTDNRIW
jgi:hypothetical protein